MFNNYIATIVRKVYSKDGNVVYAYDSTARGTYDEKKQIFIDRNGKQYCRMASVDSLKSDDPVAFQNVIDIYDLKNQLSADSIDGAIVEYSNINRQYIYYATTLSNSAPMIYPINMESVKSGAEQVIAREVQAKNAKEGIESSEQTPQASSIVEPIKVLHNTLGSYVSLIIEKIADAECTEDELTEIREKIEMIITDLSFLANHIDITLDMNEEEEKQQSSDDNNSSQWDYVDIRKVHEEVTKTLIAQDEPSLRLISEVARKLHNPELKERGILLTGNTGVGKTLLMSLLSKHLNIPFIKIDSTRITVPGYVGKDIEEFLWDLYVKCNRNLEKTERAIVFFDEIDKKGSDDNSDVFGRGVLNSLLPFIEGSTYDATSDIKHRTNSVKINTENMIIVLGGAFTQVYNDLKNDRALGFGNDVLNNNKNREAVIDDFVKKSGIPEELLGRTTIIKLNDLDVEGIKRIMLESDKSILKIQEKLFEDLGVHLKIGDDYVEAVAKMAIDKKTGARGLNTTIEETTWKAYEEAYSNFGLYTEIVLTKDTAEDPKKFIKVKRND